MPVPNVLFDDLLPTLKDTEVRVLLVVLRATLGWRDKEGRTKTRDWLSHAQLVRRTGRGSEAVSSAVGVLVRRGLIVVETSGGIPLQTAPERRRHLGRLYFRPTLERVRAGDNVGKSADPAHLGKAGTTTNIKNKKGSAHETEKIVR